MHYSKRQRPRRVWSKLSRPKSDSQKLSDFDRPHRPPRPHIPEYLQAIRSKPCIICGGAAEAHHVQYAQPRALAMKSGDHFAVPLCHACHMDLHAAAMPERTWWALRGIDPVKWAEQNFKRWWKFRNDG